MPMRNAYTKTPSLANQTISVPPPAWPKPKKPKKPNETSHRPTEVI